MKLLRRPARPDYLPITLFRLPEGMRVPDAWASYLYWRGELTQD